MGNDSYEYDETQITEWHEGNAPAQTDNAADALAFMGHLFNYAQEKTKARVKIEEYRTKRDMAILEITKRYEFAHAMMHKTFEERRMVIEKEFEIIDKGLETNNYQLVNMALQNITTLVKDNPFKLFTVTTQAQRHTMLEDGDLSIE